MKFKISLRHLNCLLKLKWTPTNFHIGKLTSNGLKKEANNHFFWNQNSWNEILCYVGNWGARQRLLFTLWVLRLIGLIMNAPLWATYTEEPCGFPYCKLHDIYLNDFTATRGYLGKRVIYIHFIWKPIASLSP